MSYEGGCFCGKIRMSYSGEPNAHVLCHCLDCRKISGSTYSNNLVVPENNFKVISGTPKTISKVADTGKTITSHFCGDCGTTLYRDGASFPNAVIIKSGILDDPEFPNKNIPKGELFASERVKWIAPIDGAAQMSGMP
ncbi:hypothetical protein LCER1_G003609 [Lachnellula cervina]|uniref:CENP-V/GFA domain-containing protein n=1 Tax=Lachnellula cervina TaxID=1316786 RepID=A0A7D8USE2_9HELO|nr:hypothetical protein LCER1_G003609 [Lachnellula cervina]